MRNYKRIPRIFNLEGHYYGTTYNIQKHNEYVNNSGKTKEVYTYSMMCKGVEYVGGEDKSWELAANAAVDNIIELRKANK